jgi:hypothetical protein
MAGGVIFAARESAAMFSSVDTTVDCSVVVPTRVIDTGQVAGRPAAMSAFAVSSMELTAESRTRVRLSAYCDQSIRVSPQVTTATSRLV